MNKNHNKNGFNSIIAGLLIILYLSIGFIPNLNAVDKIAPQWIFMTILNGVGLVYIAYNRVFYHYSIKVIDFDSKKSKNEFLPKFLQKNFFGGNYRFFYIV